MNARQKPFQEMPHDFSAIELERLREETAVSRSPYSHTFKMCAMGLLFLLVFLRLYTVTFFPNVAIVSEDILLGTALFLILYLWTRELKDRQRLMTLNQQILESQRQLEMAEIDTIAALVLAEEAKDPYVRGHSKMVARYSMAIAKEMGFSKARQRTVERAAILHDLGKLSITDKILKKPMRLSDEENEAMQHHPRRGVELLTPLRFLSRELDIILHHHEWYDGTGYPDQLRGSRIPLESRIICVADSFDAMNSKRPYRDPLPCTTIIAELKKSSGTQFDSEVVDVFLRLLENKPHFWEREED